ncbi:MAG: hypothetical protein MZU84_02205 [Sphingobacterium sp.]|nr:hypothetical protein [Sphingobacterium sp.]
MVEDGIRILINLEHRGALGGDKSTGDGAGLLVQHSGRLFPRSHGRGSSFLRPATTPWAWPSCPETRTSR